MSSNLERGKGLSGSVSQIPLIYISKKGRHNVTTICIMEIYLSLYRSYASLCSMFDEVQIFRKIIIFIFTLDPICNSNHESSISIKQNGRCSTKDRGNLSTCYRKHLPQSKFPRWPCLFSKLNQMNKINTEPFICASYQISINLSKWFQGRHFLISLSQTRTAYVGHNGCPIDRHEIWKYCTGRPLHHSYEVAFHCASQLQRRRFFLKFQSIRNNYFSWRLYFVQSRWNDVILQRRFYR